MRSIYTYTGFFDEIREYTNTATHLEAIDDLRHVLTTNNEKNEHKAVEYAPHFNPRFKSDCVKTPYKCLCGKNLKYVNVYYSNNKDDYIVIGSTCIEKMLKAHDTSHGLNIDIFVRAINDECKVCRKVVIDKTVKKEICKNICKNCRVGSTHFKCPECQNITAYFDKSGIFKCLFCFASSQIHPERIYFRVPYENKDEAKKHGAYWDSVKKLWFSYIRNNNIRSLFEMFKVYH